MNLNRVKRCLLIATAVLFAGSGMGLARELPKDSQPKEAPQKVEERVLPPHEHSAACDATSPEPVQIICILDRSGSMKALAEDTIGGYNSFLEKQRQESGAAEVTTVLFDDRYEKIVDVVDLKKAPELTSKEYYARGMTALLDAVGRTVMDTADKMGKKGICPAKRRVLFLIMTDGKENDSKEYSKATVKKMIEEATEKYHWNFVFMGANIDSVAEAESLGISARHAADYSHDSKGVQQSFARMGAAAREVRETGSVSEDWKDGEKKS